MGNNVDSVREEAVEDVLRFIDQKQKASTLTMKVGQARHVQNPNFLIVFANAINRLRGDSVVELTWYFHDNIAVSASFTAADVVLEKPKQSGGFEKAQITLACENCFVLDGSRHIPSHWEGEITVNLWNTMGRLPTELGEIFK